MRRPSPNDHAQSGFASESTAAGFKWRILEYCFDHGIDMSSSKAARLGTRMARLDERMREEFDFYRALRILGVTPDPTARTAIKHLEGLPA